MWEWLLFDAKSKTAHAVDSVIALTAQKRTHLAAVYDPNSGLRLFVDGQEEGKQSGGFSLEFAEACFNSYGDGGFGIGGVVRNLASQTKPPHGTSFGGVIEQVVISQSVRYLSDFELPSVFVSDDATVALYDFVRVSGDSDVLRNVNGQGHHGKVVEATWVERSPASTETDAGWHAKVATLPQAEAIAAVAKEFARRNPGSSVVVGGKESFARVTLAGDQAVDLAPLRGWPNLIGINLWAEPSNQMPPVDLSPLVGLPINWVDAVNHAKQNHRRRPVDARRHSPRTQPIS